MVSSYLRKEEYILPLQYSHIPGRAWLPYIGHKLQFCHPWFQELVQLWVPWAIVWLKPSGRPLCDRLPALLRRFLSKSSGTVQRTECPRAASVGMSRSKFRRQAAHLLTRLFVRRRCAEEEDNVTWGIIYTFSTWRIQWGSYATRRAVGFRVLFSFVSVQSQFGLLNLTLLK